MNDAPHSSVSDQLPEVIDKPRLDQLPLHVLRHVGNWRDPKDYPLPDSTNWKVWAWEFLRRNSEYGAFVLWCATLPKDLQTRRKPNSSDLVQHLFCTPGAPSSVRTYGEYKKWCRENKLTYTAQTPNQVLRARWGITYPLLPNEAYPATKKAKAKFKRSPKFLSVTVAHFLPEWAHTNIEHINYPGIKNISISLNPNEVLIRFRIDEPISKQTERAGVFLDLWQRRYLKANHLTDNFPLVNGNIPKPKEYVPERNDLKAVQYMVRILDAAHDPVTGQNQLTTQLVKDLNKKFNSDDDLDVLMKGKRIVSGTWKKPTISASQIRKWYNKACHYVAQNGHLEVAAHIPNNGKKKIKKDAHK